MYARRVVPILLIAGAVMMMHHGRHRFANQLEDGAKRGPHGGPHGEWGKRVPPLFEKWHRLAHEQETQATAV